MALGVVRQDFTAAILWSNDLGDIPEDFNPEEIVYELATCGFSGT